jgi:predicted SnoaL-like aldol condensation-catalyzing enzyme
MNVCHVQRYYLLNSSISFLDMYNDAFTNQGKKMRKSVLAFLLLYLLLGMHLSYASNTQQLENNKRNVLEFYQQVINEKNFDAAANYLGDVYIQHNPTSQDGPEGLRLFIQFLRDNYPEAHSDIKKIIADDDYVMLHVHSIRVPGTRGRAIFDLFKLQDGKIVEHWDTIQDIPAESANANGMF